MLLFLRNYTKHAELKIKIKVDSHPEPTHKDSYSEILRKSMPQTLNTTYKNYNSSADNFTKVEKRRRSTRIGRMKQSDLKVVEKPVNIFVSRFHADVSESEIKQFAQTRFKSATTVIVEKLKTKFDSYSSFKISIAGVPAKECLDLEQWPTGILVKKFSTLQNPRIWHLFPNLLTILMETTTSIELKVVSFKEVVR